MNRRNSISRKITLIIAESLVIVTLLGGGLMYLFGSNLLMNTIGKEYSQIAKALGAYIVKTLNDEVEDVLSYTTNPLWIDYIKERNAQYGRIDKDSIVRHFEEMDKKWVSAKEDDPLIKEYLGNRISVGMRDTITVRGKIAELFITDKYGGLVASSDKTRAFYQGDEDWWKAAYNDGKGNIYVSNIEYDDSSGHWVISIAVPVKDITGEVVGIVKDSVFVEKVYGNLEIFKIGDTGHAALIDEEGNVIFHHGIKVMEGHLFTKEELNALFLQKKPYVIEKRSAMYDKPMFSAYARIDLPYTHKKDIKWTIIISQEKAETIRPLDIFALGLIMIIILMLILVIPAGSFLGRLISKPIHALSIATEHVTAGDWDYSINIKTGDEIEEFARIFSQMIANIKSKQIELQNFSNNLEAKVEERTKELGVSQEATLNILEDLQTSKEALERTNKELMRLDELKSDFISTVSHELRTPLSIIKEGISLVLDKIPGDVNEKQAKILNISKYNIDRLARIIDSLLDISKIEAGKVELRRSLINISEVVRHTADSFEVKIKEKGLEMRLDIDKASGSVWADTDRITQVLTNLIGNAIKFTPSGRIDISCKDKGDGVVCSVSDTGVGISKEDIPKVFDKFQQFGRTAGAGDKGTGLGLSIAKNIIDMHNGAIWVESEPGKGTRFTFKLHKYTPQSLFREYASKAVEKAADEGDKMSIIAVNFSLTEKDMSGVINKRFIDIINESARLIKDTLRREGDDVVNSGGEMIVILADCDKESAAKVQYRLEEIVGKYLADQNADGAIRVNYGCATYPDDAKGAPELIVRAKAALAVPSKA